MSIVLIVEALIVIFFLLMFLRRPTLVWGIGLITTTSAILLDTFLATFGRQEMLDELGFFFFVVGGMLTGGAATWVWGLLRPQLGTAVSATAPSGTPGPAAPQPASQEWDDTAVDRQMLYTEIRTRLGREDVLDLMFDLGINENDVMPLHQDMNQLIVNIMDYAAAQGKTGALALAVERILTPLPPENLPRLEKIDIDTPSTILRHYLLAYFSLETLQTLVATLGIDWEALAGTSKNDKARNLLLYLSRRNRLDEFIGYLHQTFRQ